MHPLRLRLVALFAGVALLLPEAAFARTHYFCRMMDRVLESACCCDGDGSQNVDIGAKVEAPDCCARVTPPSRSVAPNAPDVTVSVPEASIVTVLTGPVGAPLPARDLGTSEKLARGPPPLGPPLFLTHCSFLI